jgi:hypothetical protein
VVTLCQQSNLSSIHDAHTFFQFSQGVTLQISEEWFPTNDLKRDGFLWPPEAMHHTKHAFFNVLLVEFNTIRHSSVYMGIGTEMVSVHNIREEGRGLGRPF